jgi:cell division protein FtsL
MDLFTILVIVLVLMVLIGVYMIFRFKNSKKGEIIVSYSEKIGDTIIEHNTEYKGYINEKDDVMNIPALKLKRPVPPREVMLSTNSGKKKVYLIKIDNFRYGFRIPNLHNSVLVYNRDKNGNIIKKNGKPLLTKFQWQFTDNVIEPDIVHWEENILDELRRKHLARQTMLDKWLAPISMVLIFLFAVVALNMSTKQMTLDKEMIMDKATQAEKDAKETSNNLNNFLEKVTGQRILETDQDRALYYNSTG